jgi:hypothetical protein
MTTKIHRWVKSALLAGVATAAWPAFAAEVTAERLANPEAQNWLMNHRCPYRKLKPGNIDDVVHRERG